MQCIGMRRPLRRANSAHRPRKTRYNSVKSTAVRFFSLFFFGFPFASLRASSFFLSPSSVDWPPVEEAKNKKKSERMSRFSAPAHRCHDGKRPSRLADDNHLGDAIKSRAARFIRPSSTVMG